MDLNSMCIFTKVAETKSITSASQMLGISKQTISRKIIQLEESLGVCLIRRTTRNFELTTAGQAYFQYCTCIVQQAEEANAMVKSLQSTPVGEIKVSMPLAFNNNNAMSKLFTNFLKKTPQVKIDIHLSNRRTCLISEGIDMAFRLGPLVDSTMIARGLGVLTFTYVASPEYVEMNGLPDNPNDVINHTIIAMHDCKLLDDFRINEKIGDRVQINDFSLAKQMAMDGFGIAVLPVFMCVDEIREGILIPIQKECFQPTRHLNLVYTQSRHQPAHVRKFINHVVEETRPIPPWEIYVDDVFPSPHTMIPPHKNVDREPLLMQK
ncbi:LysR family transcriptional regulator [Hahella sp. CR1]|uniref:LysR family transcriptional regulator n=2 Tax=Hahella TaxID=158481 RepID=UPI001C1EE4D7|nr:LysR family transcriptional regulator [Hahella sp. CR1]MBU6950852.1 LysR family transcriptional regulator [Hahella sp. HN01]MDG9667253.1 LysR family transcriptional regulator [Hahella sp. CR1]